MFELCQSLLGPLPEVFVNLYSTPESSVDTAAVILIVAAVTSAVAVEGLGEGASLSAPDVVAEAAADTAVEFSA